MKSVLITGVSTGIGYATSKLLCSQNIQVFGSVRNEQDAEQLQEEFGANYIPLIFDVTDEVNVKKAATFVRNQLNGKTLWGLINNAGIVVSGALLYLPIDEFKKQLDVNLIGPLIVTQAFAPLLGAEKGHIGSPGKIINISSVAGKNAFPFMGPYCISKHGVEAFSESLRRELMIFGIDVIIVAPGAIKTNIWEKVRKQIIPPELKESIYNESVSVFRDFMLDDAEKIGLPAEEIAKLLLDILQTERPKTRYAPIPKKLTHWIIPNLLPKRLVDQIIAKRFGLLNRQRP
jgi:NAD(P)-dependent dehydrogenase (short-subunit alcohol dehydrogenase family)